MKDVVNANLYAMYNYQDYSSHWYEVGSGDARPFEDVLDILGIEYTYHSEYDIPKGYQFYTKSSTYKWMYGWEPEWDLEKGLKDYLGFLNQ